MLSTFEVAAKHSSLAFSCKLSAKHTNECICMLWLFFRAAWFQLICTAAGTLILWNQEQCQFGFHSFSNAFVLERFVKAATDVQRLHHGQLRHQPQN